MNAPGVELARLMGMAPPHPVTGARKVVREDAKARAEDLPNAPHLLSMAQRRMWAVLQEGPSTSSEIVVELGNTNVKHVSMTLQRWADRGFLRRVERRVSSASGRSGAPAWVYEIAAAPREESGDGDAV